VYGYEDKRIARKRVYKTMKAKGEQFLVAPTNPAVVGAPKHREVRN
jgi:hypothetical protein